MLKGKGIITPIQKDILAIFSVLPDQEQFYLTGGTALAEFFLGHRFSFDLDFFCKEENLILPLSYLMERAYAHNGFQVSVTRRFATFVEFLLTRSSEETARIDLALDSPFQFEKPVLSEYGVWVNNYKDLAVDKVLAYYGRIEPRDAVDMFFIFQQEDPNKLLFSAREKDPGFDLYWFAAALNRAEEFPNEVERWPVKMLIPFEVGQLKVTFQRLALQMLSKTLLNHAKPE